MNDRWEPTTRSRGMEQRYTIERGRFTGLWPDVVVDPVGRSCGRLSPSAADALEPLLNRQVMSGREVREAMAAGSVVEVRTEIGWTKVSGGWRASAMWELGSSVLLVARIVEEPEPGDEGHACDPDGHCNECHPAPEPESEGVTHNPTVDPWNCAACNPDRLSPTEWRDTWRRSHLPAPVSSPLPEGVHEGLVLEAGADGIEGWEYWHGDGICQWFPMSGNGPIWSDQPCIVRPSPEPRTEQVAWHEAVGRTLPNGEVIVVCGKGDYAWVNSAWPHLGTPSTFDTEVQADADGLVSVLADGDQETRP